MRGQLNHKLFLLVMLTIFLIGAVTFLFGFFPVAYQNFDKEPQDGFNNSRPTSVNGQQLRLPAQKYDQIVLMLVDALRYDFVTADLMPLTYQGRCNILKLLVSVPTVTMPRIKSLTTGTISNFIDIILNLGHTEQLADSILHQLYKRGDLITFAGDRTWVNLFPDKFHRKAANIDSFFVNDFYEGDENVTRVMETELQHNDWKLLILHYLGLDHIGHVEGTSSPKLPLKLREMDYVISKIYSLKHLRGQMLLLTSDHGMRNGGGHGGSTQEELYVPLLFFTEHCKTKSSIYTDQKQIDLAPTLAILFSIDIPKSSIGCLLPELLEELSLEDQLYAYYYNAQHLINKAIAKYGEGFVNDTDYFASYVKAQWAHEKFLKAINSKSTMATLIFEQTKADYMQLSRHISDELSESLGGFHYDLIGIGLMLTTLSTVYTFISVFLKEHSKSRYKLEVKKISECCAVGVAINMFCHAMQYIEKSSALRACLLTVPITAIVYLTVDIVRSLFLPHMPLRLNKQLKLTLPLLTPLTTFFLFHTMSLASSSFIEEEDEMWYYLGGTMTIVLLITTYGSNVGQDYDMLGSAICNILQRETWEMRWALFVPIITASLRRHNNYFVAVLSKAENRPWLSWGLAGGLIALLVQLQSFNRRPLQLIICAIALCSVYCFRGAIGSVCFFDIPSFNALALPLFWISIGLLAALGFKSVILLRKRDLFALKSKTQLAQLMSGLLQTNLTCSLLIAVLLHKPHNVALVPAMIFLLHKCYKLYDRLHCHTRAKAPNQLYALMQKTLLTIIVGKMFYFCQGNSNSLATIDLNPGYIGQSSYNPLVVATLVTLNTYSAPINAFFYLMVHIAGGQEAMQKERLGTQLLILDSSRLEQELVHIAISVYTAATLLPVAVYMWLLVLFRYHLFIYSVFSPKVLYECFSVLVFYLLFLLTNLYSIMFQ